MNRSISHRFLTLQKSLLKSSEVKVISDKYICSVKVTTAVLIMGCEVSQVPRLQGRQPCNTALISSPE